MYETNYEYDRMRKVCDERQRIAGGLIGERDFPCTAYESDLSDDELDRYRQYARAPKKYVEPEARPEDVYKWAEREAGGRPYKIMVSTLPETEYKGGRVYPNMFYIVRDPETEEEIAILNGYLL